MKKILYLLIGFNFFFSLNSFCQQEPKGIEFAEINGHDKEIFLSSANITEGILLTINGILNATTKANLTLKDNTNVVIPQVAGQAADQATFKIVAANFSGLTDANNVTLQLSNNGAAIGKIILKKETAPDPPPDLSKFYLQKFKTDYGKDFVGGKIVFNEKLNQARERKIIHIFLDDNGTFYSSSLPTTAREDNLYVFHVFYKKGTNAPRLEYDGSYDPTFQVEGANKTTTVAATNSAGAPENIEISEIKFGAIGPFTGSFTVKITGSSKLLVNKTIKVAPLHHITLNTGFYASFLRNPDNIQTFVKPNGDTTLVSDDPTSRGFINIMLTFYPYPRNIYFPSGDWRERLAFNLGTTISKNLSENMFGGVSYDISRGLALGIGAHYGRRSYVIDQPDFKFGEDKFSGSLTNRVKKRWDIGFYAGVTLDIRLLSFLFNQAPAAK